MKRLLILFLAIISYIGMYAQFAKISCGPKSDNLNIVQIDTTQFSNVVYMEYETPQTEGVVTYGEKTFVRINGTDKKYHLLDGLNMPISTEGESRYVALDKEGQKHRFALEFERFPIDEKFSIFELEDESADFRITDIEVDTTARSEKINYFAYIANYPVKERGMFIQNDQTITCYKTPKLNIFFNLYRVKEYGKYYQVNLSIQNVGKSSFLFNIDNVKAEGYIYDKQGNLKDTIPLDVLSATQYDKKVANKQAWNNFFVALGEGLAAANAGYSSTATSYYGNSYTTSNAYAYGTGGYASAYGTSYTTTYGQAYSTHYNGYASYLAQQQASENYANYATGQTQIREQLNEGYLKNNTVKSGVEYGGFFNIKYKKIDFVKVTITLAGEDYYFLYRVR